ncbi:MAG: primase-helicase family protein, partial [bacterium]
PYSDKKVYTVFNHLDRFKEEDEIYEEDKKKAIKDIDEFIYRNLCGGSEYHGNTLKLLLGRLIAYPDKKLGKTIIFNDPGQGIGKNVFQKYVLSPIFNPNNVNLITFNNIGNRFNRSVLTSQLIGFVDETEKNINKSVYEVLKRITTEDRMFLEEKYQISKTENVYLNLIICSNFQETVNSILQSDKRRYYVIETGNINDIFPKIHERSKYFKDFISIMKKYGGIAPKLYGKHLYDNYKKWELEHPGKSVIDLAKNEEFQQESDYFSRPMEEKFILDLYLNLYGDDTLKNIGINKKRDLKNIIYRKKEYRGFIVNKTDIIRAYQTFYNDHANENSLYKKNKDNIVKAICGVKLNDGTRLIEGLNGGKRAQAKEKDTNELINNITYFINYSPEIKNKVIERFNIKDYEEIPEEEIDEIDSDDETSSSDEEE